MSTDWDRKEVNSATAVANREEIKSDNDDIISDDGLFNNHHRMKFVQFVSFVYHYLDRALCINHVVEK